VLGNADLDLAMWAVDSDGRSYRGFYAFRLIARRIPLLWWMVPLLYLPGVAPIGVRTYALVARNRSRLGCRVDLDG
jgi:predicted DCC family thiol-disulfide oxidoreductase YuxK